MKRMLLTGGVGALVLAAAGTAGADIVDVGTFSNTSDGVNYEGAFGAFVSAQEQGPRGEYVVITIDLAGLLDFAGYDAFTNASVIDGGDNIYTSSPGADIDLFQVHGLDAGLTPLFSYNGPTQEHQSETAVQLLQRVEALDWADGNGTLGSMTYVSLGDEGRLTSNLGGWQMIRDGQGLRDVFMTLSEAGSSEVFSIQIEAMTVPAPGACAIIGAAAWLVTMRRRRSA